MLTPMSTLAFPAFHPGPTPALFVMKYREDKNKLYFTCNECTISLWLCMKQLLHMHFWKYIGQAHSQMFLKGGSEIKGGAKRRRKFLLINFSCGQ